MTKYGYYHRLKRAAHLANAAVDPPTCPRCGKPVLPGEAADLGHIDGTNRTHGLEHASCNRSAGAQNAARKKREGKRNSLVKGDKEKPRTGYLLRHSDLDDKKAEKDEHRRKFYPLPPGATDFSYFRRRT